MRTPSEIKPRRFIYALLDPRTDEVRYIGQSSTGMHRPSVHWSPSYFMRDDTPKNVWVRELRALGTHYGVRILEALSEDASLDDAERRWIAFGRENGWLLTNLMDGGLGGALPPESVSRMAAALRGRPPWNKGRATPEDVRARLRIARLGIPASELSKRRSSEVHRGNRHAAKLSEPDVVKVRALLASGVPNKEIARVVNIDPAQVSRIKNGKAHRGVQ